jgi:hypothetical protein
MSIYVKIKKKSFLSRQTDRQTHVQLETIVRNLTKKELDIHRLDEIGQKVGIRDQTEAEAKEKEEADHVEEGDLEEVLHQVELGDLAPEPLVLAARARVHEVVAGAVEEVAGLGGGGGGDVVQRVEVLTLELTGAIVD